jgi:hypothetical protein
VSSAITVACGHGCERPIEVAFGAGMQDREFKPEAAGRDLRVSRSGLGKSGTGRVDEQGNEGCRGDQGVQQLHPLRHYLQVQRGHARKVAARPAPASASLKYAAAVCERNDQCAARAQCARASPIMVS